MGGFHHKCGIVSCYKDPALKRDLYTGSMWLNHRGLEGTGFCVDVGGSLLVSKDLGLVNHVFPQLYGAADFKAETGFAHNRYSTTGDSKRDNLQPIRVSHVAVGHNGNLVNTEALRSRYEKTHQFKTGTDTEAIACIFDEAKGDMLEGAKRCFDLCEGSYNLMVMNSDGDLAVLRDPWAIHPLHWVPDDEGEHPIYVASEDCALHALGIYDDTKIKEFPAGTVTIMKKNGDVSSHNIRTGEKKLRCYFEPFYFMHYASSYKGMVVSEIRRSLGRRLAERMKERGIKPDLVCLMPDSGNDYAYGVHQATGIEMVQALGSNRFAGRTYMAPQGKGEDFPAEINFSRLERVRLKSRPIPNLVRGKIVAIPDDSNVRGNTNIGITDELYRAGAEEVHWLIASPPIRGPCLLGMDHAVKSQLIAAPFLSTRDAEEGVAKAIGAASVTYLEIGDAAVAIGDEKDHDWGCVVGTCPFNLSDAQRRLFE